MNLFVDYVQPLTEWLQQNPNWALFITFLISLAESLAIIGSIVPGSVTMTAIGILAGSGVMRIDLTLFAATLGAVAGDSLSYTIGYVYSERLVDIWPFSRYPHWIQYGKDFFATHGGKSVLIGRFVGPLRSIIPVIAGILHMKQWRFLIANVISAIGWSLLYVMPGVIIGAASHELSTESATRLFIVILILLVLVWILSILIKWLFKILQSFLKQHLHNLWIKLEYNTLIGNLCRALTPTSEKNHYTTASLALITLFCSICFIVLLGLTLQGQWINSINIPTHLFIQSFHNFLLEAFFIFSTQLISPATIITLFVICSIWFVIHDNSKAIIYASCLLILTTLLADLMAYYVYHPRPNGLLVIMQGSSFPAPHIMVATAFYGFVLFYINSIHYIFTNPLRTAIFTILILAGCGTLYLGDYWLTDILAAYLAGTVCGLVCCLMYRKTHFFQTKIASLGYMIPSLFAGILVASSVSTYFNFHALSYNHSPYKKEFRLTDASWWNQQKPILPIYRLNRIGKKISLLNLQFSGDLDELEIALADNGWVPQTESFFTNLMTWINRKSNGVKLPLLTQLYENRAPSLVMIYSDDHSKLNLELRFWESNYNLVESKRPLWIGSVHPSAPYDKRETANRGYYPELVDILSYLRLDTNEFHIRKVVLPKEVIKATTYPTQPYIILIKRNG